MFSRPQHAYYPLLSELFGKEEIDQDMVRFEVDGVVISAKLAGDRWTTTYARLLCTEQWTISGPSEVQVNVVCDRIAAAPFD